jgi:hypothetical protein
VEWPRWTSKFFMQLFEQMMDYDGTAVLEKIRVPTLIVSGSKDGVTPASHQYAMQKKNKGKRTSSRPLRLSLHTARSARVCESAGREVSQPTSLLVACGVRLNSAASSRSRRGALSLEEYRRG